MSQIISFDTLKQRRQESQIYQRWIEHYKAQAHEDLLEALVYEHENDFPMRRSPELLDQLKHKALVRVLQERAQTEFLKTLLDEINAAQQAEANKAELPDSVSV
jgi:hypothetical protein